MMFPSKKGQEIQAYMKISASCCCGGEQSPYHDPDEEEEEDPNAMVMSAPDIEQEGFLLCVRIFSVS